MKWILHLSILSIYVSSTIAIAQDSGFHSPSDMNYKEPFFSLGADKGRSASVSVGDVNGDGMPDVVVANGRHWPQINQIFLGQSGRFQVSMPDDGAERYLMTSVLLSRKALAGEDGGKVQLDASKRKPIGTGPFFAKNTGLGLGVIDVNVDLVSGLYREDRTLVD